MLMYFLFLLPAILLMMWAQGRVRMTYHHAQQIPASCTGAEAAAAILRDNGLDHVEIHETPGFLSDHYDPSQRLLRLSPDVFDGRNAAAVGIAAHEAGHAIQHATNYKPLVIRNAAVPAAMYGPMVFIVLMILGAILGMLELVLLGIIAYSAVCVFQLINLPVEFDASNRAKKLLAEYDILDAQGAVAVNKVLGAAAWTYVAGALQSILTLAYYAMMLLGGSRD